ncbi:MAG TPA: hypothetical protein PLM98_00845 [Thiolinea sp.]|nr:hypothetical protein [Thiolinea sp.]
MVDPSLLGIQLPMPSTQVVPQPLPMPAANDSTRFQDLLTGIGQGGQVDSPSMRDQPVLQKIDSNQVDKDQGFKDAFIERITGMDKSYHSIMEQLKDRPQLSSYINEASDSTANNLRTYPNVSSNSTTNQAAELKGMIEDERKNNAAMLNYQHDVNTWSMNFQMWSSGVELASSIVSQLSKGFQTLFRASG